MSAVAPSLLDPQTALRSLSADEAPYPGWLHAGAPPTIWVDVALLADEVWRCAPDGHILTPVDVARSPEGLAAVLPHCPTRLGGAQVDHAAPGAAVTIAVSMVRAASEAREHDITEGSWWVDASGRPVLAAHAGSSWAVSAGELLERLATGAGPMLSGALAGSAELLSQARWSAGELDACEEALFAAADPEPLAGEQWHSGAEQLGDGAPPLPLRATTVRATRREAVAPVAESWLARFTDAGWAERVGDAVRGVRALTAAPGRLWQRARSRRERGANAERPPEGSPAEQRRHSRRAPLLVAGAVGAVVIGAGLLWPDSASTAGSAPVGPMPVSTVDAASPSAHSGEPSPSASASGASETTTPPLSDLEEVAMGALNALAACAADTADDVECGTLLERPETALPGGVVVAGAADATATLLDEYGGVAVFRVAATGQSAQILVLVSVDGKWLVRDVYDVADQP